MATLSIRRIIERISNGQIRIPRFQRRFVWEPEMVAFLMDSIYKDYPFGSLLFWRTSEQLTAENCVGPFDLIDSEPGYPIDYVLDGQQRITSIFGVFQTELVPQHPAMEFDIYFDFSVEVDAQESQFFALKDADVDLNRHFPLRALFDTTGYRAATQHLPDEVIPKIDHLQERFKEAVIPVEMFETEDDGNVAIVFERINRKGVELDTFQLLNAWTWTNDFDLQNSFEELQDELQPFGFRPVGEDVNLVLRCAAGILTHSSSAASLIDVNGALIRDRFDEITNGLRGAIDFLRVNLGVRKLSNLPYSSSLIPLSAFFAIQGNQQIVLTNPQRSSLLRWFWKSCFSRRFSAGTLRSLNHDIGQMINLRNNNPNTLDEIDVEVTNEFYSENQFQIGTVNTKTFVLQLAQNSPRSFVSGNAIDLANVLQDYNRNEFHHIFPKAHLRNQGIAPDQIGQLANFCFLSRADNNLLGGQAPSIYRDNMDEEEIGEILDSAFIDPGHIFNDDYVAFLNRRIELLVDNGNALIN